MGVSRGLWNQERGHYIHTEVVIEALRLNEVAKDGHVDEKRGKKMCVQYRYDWMNQIICLLCVPPLLIIIEI